MSRYVLDASAILALIEQEPGADVVTEVLADAAIGAVNLAEVHSKLSERGRAGSDALREIVAVVNEVVPFDEEQAEITGNLRSATRHLGLSLGDRACLALGLLLRAEVYTAETAWQQLNLLCPVRLIR